MEVAKHKTHSSEHKAKVAIKAIRGESTLFELARLVYMDIDI